MPIFKRRIDAKITKALRGPKTKRSMLRRANSMFGDAKEDFLNDVDNDPISRRISSDAFTQGYFGFYPEDAPVEDLKDVFDRRIDINEKPNIKANQSVAEYKYNIKYPSRRDVYSESVLNLPWISASWVEKVERGIGNLESFLFKRDKGRSDLGVQIKSRNGFQNRYEPRDEDYLDRLRSNFAESLKKGGLK